MQDVSENLKKILHINVRRAQHLNVNVKIIENFHFENIIQF